MKIGLETESFHLHFITGQMDAFSYIHKAVELGVDGVIFNVIPWPGLPGWGTLKSFEPGYLKRVKKELQKHGLFVEIDTNGTDPNHLTKIIEAAHIIGADVIRTYCCFGVYERERLDKAPEDLLQILPLLKKYRIKMGVENHEHEISSEIIEIVKKVNSPWIGAHCDIGNSMMAWEDPIEAVKNLAPYAYTTHFKDHIIIEDQGEYKVCGVPAGKGNIDTEECFKILVNESNLTRINIEMCYPYSTSFQRTQGTGGIEKVGEGPFKVEEAPSELNIINPADYYYPPDEAIEQMLAIQEKGVKESVNYVLGLRDKYCR